MNIYLSGAALITHHQVYTWHGGVLPYNPSELFMNPPLLGMLGKKASRTGRFDRYTRAGCAAAGLALWDSHLTHHPPQPIGLILAGQFGCLETDLEYYGTTTGNGQLSSPNLFSYTLPNIVLGECALQYGLTGPGYCLDGSGGVGQEALTRAARHLTDPTIPAMLAGWLEMPPPQAPHHDSGAMMLLLEKSDRDHSQNIQLTLQADGTLLLPNGQSISSIHHLMAYLNMDYLELGSSASEKEKQNNPATHSPDLDCQKPNQPKNQTKM